MTDPRSPPAGDAWTTAGDQSTDDGQTAVGYRVTDGGQVVLDPGDLPEELPDDPVGGVVLAAGRGTRFEAGNKLLATVDDEAIVRRATRTLVESTLPEVVVVVGHEREAVAETVSDLDVDVVYNPDYGEGQSTSMHRGVEVARERGWAATVFGLGDVPAVDPASVDRLLRAWAAGEAVVLPAAHRGKRGNPVLFDAATYDELLAVEGDTGGRPVIRSSSDVALVETGDPGVTRDVDREADLESFG